MNPEQGDKAMKPVPEQLADLAAKRREHEARSEATRREIARLEAEHQARARASDPFAGQAAQAEARRKAVQARRRRQAVAAQRRRS